MIVRSADGMLQLITQPDHARVAGLVMAQCLPLSERPRRRSILHAIAEHDNGWAEEDAAPTVNVATGAIADFVNLRVDARQALWPRGIGRLLDDPWAAALVAQHAITIYDRFRPDPDWSAFFHDMERTRAELLRGSPLDDLLTDYVFVRLGDLISLTFCTGWSDEQRFGGWSVLRSGSHIVVTPDAFGGATIPIEITAREIRNQPFRSDAELRAALTAARRIALTGEVGSR